MMSQYDKAIVAILIPLIAWLNQKYGFKFPVDADTLSAIVGMITAAAVYLVPNKLTTVQVADAKVIAVDAADKLAVAKASPKERS